MDISSKTALITGGTHGIGSAIATSLARQAGSISVVARNTEASSIRKQMEDLCIPFLLISADLSREEECKRVVQETIDRFGAVDILIHSAGAAAGGGLLNGARAVWYQAFDIHVHAAFHLCAAAVPSMRERKGGAIVFISSAAGLRGVKNALAYAVVKGAIPQFTRALAMELSDFNIRVNCVSPGVIRTRFQDYLSAEQIKNNLDNRIPLHREGKPEDVADAVEMLIKNDFITGENIVIDGGMTMRIV